MSPSVPSRLPLEELAANAGTLRGCLDAAMLSARTAQALGVARPRGRIAYVLEFSRSPAGAIAIGGTLEACLEAQCQRCLEPFELTLNTPVRFLVPAGETTVEAPPGWEIVELEMQPRLVNLLEEELLLALPIAPRHLPDDCPARLPEATPPAEPRPFAELAQALRERRD